MKLLDVPYELLLQVISNLSCKQTQSLVQCSARLYRYTLDDYFWFDLCRLKGVNYCHPDITWKQLYNSDDLSTMCPHLSHSICKSLSMKRHQLWSHSFKGNDILCLHSSCDYLGADTDHHHPIVLKLSPLHALELWCNSCVKAIGFDGFAPHVKHGVKTEIYIMKKIVNYLTSTTKATTTTSIAHPYKNIIQSRQYIESNLYQYQYRQATMHIIDRRWFAAWIEFISGKSNQIPGSLSNTKLYLADGSLNPTLTLGQDFELIGSLNRWYIERIYGVVDKIISADDLPNNAKYCKMIHKIRIRQQMNRTSTSPPF